MSSSQEIIERVQSVGVIPCIKVPDDRDLMPYAEAMVEGGSRVIEITMTTPRALDSIERIAARFGDRLCVAAGTVLDPETARQVILCGGKLLVSPTVRPQVIAMANRYGVPMFSGAFTATECQLAMESGVAMVKIFPAAVAGPAYMTNLKMVFPEIKLCPSGGISLENAPDYIRAGACAVSANRDFMNSKTIAEHGFKWLTAQVARFIDTVRQARQAT